MIHSERLNHAQHPSRSARSRPATVILTRLWLMTQPSDPVVLRAPFRSRESTLLDRRPRRRSSAAEHPRPFASLQLCFRTSSEPRTQDPGGVQQWHTHVAHKPNTAPACWHRLASPGKPDSPSKRCGMAGVPVGIAQGEVSPSARPPDCLRAGTSLMLHCYSTESCFCSETSGCGGAMLWAIRRCLPPAPVLS